MDLIILVKISSSRIICVAGGFRAPNEDNQGTQMRSNDILSHSSSGLAFHFHGPPLKTVTKPFPSQYFIGNSPYCQPDNSYNVSLENLLLDQLINC